MLRIQRYKLGFDRWGFVLFMIIMLPNFIWFAFPAPNDILRNDSVTAAVDVAAQIFQVLTVTTLCIVINVRREQPMQRSYRTGIFFHWSVRGSLWSFMSYAESQILFFNDMAPE